MFKTIADIRAAHQGHFFDRKTMRFWHSKIYRGVYGGRYFVTSEQVPECSRKFSVRQIDEHGRIDTVGEFNQIGTLEEARAIAREVASKLRTEAQV